MKITACIALAYPYKVGLCDEATLLTTLLFLNQARAWFLKIDPVRIVCMRACVSAPEAINN